MLGESDQTMQCTLTCLDSAAEGSGREGVDRSYHRARLSKETFVSNDLELFWSEPTMAVDFVRQESSDFPHEFRKVLLI